MANDLSRAEVRTTQQDRITRNRDAMFRRNNAEAPTRRYLQDLRNASRGDNGAGALLDALGMVQRAGKDFQNYAGARQDEKDKADGAQGLMDAQAGTVDPEKERKSRAYRDTLSLGRAQRKWSEGLAGFDAEVQELIQNQDALDPDQRRAEINDLLDDYYRRFAVGEDGNLADFGSPAANRWLAEQMANTRQVALTQAGAAIEKRMGEESVTNMTTTAREQLLAGQDLDYGTLLSTLLPSVDKKSAMQDLITTVKGVAMELEEKDAERGMRIIDGLLGFARTQPAATPGQSLEQQFDAAFPQGGEAPASAGYVSPFSGFDPTKRSGKIGDARSGGRTHNGEDFPTPVGTPVVAPMGGEVVDSYRNARGGHQVRIRLDDGTVVGFAHLSSRGVKKGDRVEAGQQVALSGNTGKSSGPHVHMTAERNGRKVSPSEVFAGAPRGGAAAPTPTAPLDRSILDPQTPSEAADAAGPAQLTAPTGALTLTADQRLSLNEFRRTYRRAADQAAEARRNEEQGANAYEFVARTAGIGAYPTAVEVQQAVREGRLNPQQGATILNTMEADRRQRQADVKSLAGEGEELEREGKEQRVESVVQSLLGPVYRGRKSPAAISAELLRVAAAEPDLEVRQAILRTAGEELNKVTSLRTKGPEYQEAAQTLDTWQQTYVNSLTGRRLPRGMTKEAAESLIKQQLDKFASRLGAGEVAPDRVEPYLKRGEATLDRWFDLTFPRRDPNRPN